MVGVICAERGPVVVGFVEILKQEVAFANETKPDDDENEVIEEV